MKNCDALLTFISRLAKDTEITLTPETPLFEEKIITSMNILDIMGYLEKQLGRKLTDDELVMSNFRSVRTIAEKFL